MLFYLDIINKKNYHKKPVCNDKAKLAIVVAMVVYLVNSLISSWYIEIAISYKISYGI